ncbi:hypothetical protein [Micromonospora sp. WMMC273]|nr:hypothetical protein [Micromonospora sp. WMMC273]MCZ7478907.1 hypothetical protein [Micromonospora sp. WMMC273]
MCGCRKAASGKVYVVTYPDGTTKEKYSELGAKLAAAAVPGATYRVKE